MISRILQKNIALYILLLALGALTVLFLHFRQVPSINQPVIVAGRKTIPVTIADTPALREQGLSDTSSLTPKTGKLFIFDIPDTYGFWMKDMSYPLDIVWIDSDWKVIDISSNVSPNTYPSVFHPTTPAHYVLEINANEAGVDNITEGTQLVFEPN